MGGLDCTKNREFDLLGLLTVRGFGEVYMPFSGSGQHVYIGTKQNPIGVSLLGFRRAKRLPDARRNSIRAGAGLKWSLKLEDKGTGITVICDWYWHLEAAIALNADFAVTYVPASLDASVSIGASVGAGAGACGVDLNVGASVQLTGRMFISAQQRFFEGTASGSVTMPVIPDISFSFPAKVSF